MKETSSVTQKIEDLISEDSNRGCLARVIAFVVIITAVMLAFPIFIKILFFIARIYINYADWIFG